MPRTHPCQTAGIPANPCRRGQFASREGSAADCGPARETPGLSLIALLIAIALALAAWLLFRRRSGHDRHRRAMAGVLDAADALEARLRTARSEIEAVAGDGADPVREAMQEMLRQRLWLQQHGAQASLQQIDDVRRSMEEAGGRLEQQLARVRDARAPVA